MKIVFLALALLAPAVTECTEGSGAAAPLTLGITILSTWRISGVTGYEY